MPYKEHQIVKKYSTIGDIAKALKVQTSLLRFWEDEFLSFTHKFYFDKHNGERRFIDENRDFIGLIFYYVKVEKHTHEGARRKLLLNHGIECQAKSQMRRFVRDCTLNKFL